MSDFDVFVLVMLGLLVLFIVSYIVARLVAVAWHKTKEEYHRSTTTNEEHQNGTDKA